jgi:nitroreductase
VSSPELNPECAENVDVLSRLTRDRYSCRAYRAEPIPKSIIEDILRIAQRAPSWCNVQPWQAIVTSGAGSERFRQALYQHAAAHAPAADFSHPREYRGIYAARRRECGVQLYQSLNIGRDNRAAAQAQSLENFHLFGAPHVAIVTTDEALGVYGAIDCGVYLGHFLLAAQSFGVATTAQASIAFYPDFIRNYFGLTEDRRVVFAISFGYADEAHPVNSYRTSRATVEQATTWVNE